MYLSVPHSLRPQSGTKEGSSPQALSGACAELTATPAQGRKAPAMVSAPACCCPCQTAERGVCVLETLTQCRGCAYRMTSDAEGPLPRIRVGAFNRRAIELTRNTQYMSQSSVAFLQLHTSQSEHLHGSTQTSQRQHGGD